MTNSLRASAQDVQLWAIPLSRSASPAELGLHRTMEMTSAPPDRTFFYRGTDKRVIEVGYIDTRWLDQERGPTIYAVTDYQSVIRYVGKHEGLTPLRARWFRHGYVHHQRSSRSRFLSELDANRSPLTLWSAPVKTLAENEVPDTGDLKAMVRDIEATWIHALHSQLWNKQRPSRLTRLL